MVPRRRRAAIPSTMPFAEAASMAAPYAFARRMD
jgi:hypothetical protein